MKKILLFSILGFGTLLYFSGCRKHEPPPSSTPTTLTLQPDSSTGKDAMIWYITSQTTSKGPVNSNNYGNDVEFPAMDWTFDGSPGTLNSLIEFDLSSIPSTANIVSAKLSLYACPTCGNPGHEALGSETNIGVIQRITSTWEEKTVTWNTQPSVTSQNQILLPASTSASEDYLDTDVKNLVQDIVSNPSTSHGFMISMLVHNYYKRLIFSSSDHPDYSKHPKLVVQYQ